MKLTDLSPSIMARLRQMLFDRFINKHEGPWDWDSVLDHHQPECLHLDGYNVLLPVPKDQHPNISLVRCIVGDFRNSLTLFLKNTTYAEDPRSDLFLAGFVAICDRFPDQDFYVTILYHEWFMVTNG
jgi:hypothetical protein